MNLFVARLDYGTQSEDLRDAFERYGPVDSAKVIFDHYTGNSRGFGFVEMPNDSDALVAIEEMDGTELDGRRIVVKKAKPKNQSNDRSNGDSGYNGGW